MSLSLKNSSGASLVEAGVVIAIFMTLAIGVLPLISFEMTKRNCAISISIKQGEDGDLAFDPQSAPEILYFQENAPGVWDCFNFADVQSGPQGNGVLYQFTF